MKDVNTEKAMVEKAMVEKADYCVIRRIDDCFLVE